MTPGADPLAQLHDIHLPPPVGWWPPAIGWWLLLGLILLATIAIWWWLRHWRSQAFRREALRELQQLRQTSDALARITALSILLRRTALAIAPREVVAGLTGLAWLHFLDNSGNTNRFSTGPGKLLLDAPYRPAMEEETNTDALLNLAEDWIKKARYRP